MRTWTLLAMAWITANLAAAQGATTLVEDLPFAHRPQTLRSGVFFNDRFASNRWEIGDPDPPPVESSHYAYFSERYIAGAHESTKPFGLWQYATVATNGVTQGDYTAGKAAFLAYLKHPQASPGSWLAADTARKSRKTVLQVTLMPWYLSESSNTTVVEGPILHAHRRMYTSQAAYTDLVYAYAYELITTIDWTDRERYWEGPITEPQRYWRGNLAQLSQLYQDFARAIEAAETDATTNGLSTGTYKVGGSSTAAWWMAITVTDSPPGPTDGPDPGPPSPLIEINKRLIDDHLLDPATPLDFLSWHQVRTPTFLYPDTPYPGLPESQFGGVEPGWCSTAMTTTRGWVTAAGGDPDELEYILTEWYNLLEGYGDPPGIYAAVCELNSRANIARSDLGGAGFELATRTVWEDWSNVPAGDDGGPGLYHKVGRYPKPLMTMQEALHALGSMEEAHVEYENYAQGAPFSATVLGRTGTSYRVVEGHGEPWTLALESAGIITVTSVTRMNGTTTYPGVSEAPPPAAKSISIPAAAWEVLLVEFEVESSCFEVTYCETNPDNAADISIDGCDCGQGSLNVRLSSGPPGNAGYLLVGAGSGTVTDPPGAMGDLCLAGGPIGRYVMDVGVIDGGGNLATDIVGGNTGGGSGALPPPLDGSLCVPPGQTWNFQYWHRDGTDPSRFSSALTVTFR